MRSSSIFAWALSSTAALAQVSPAQHAESAVAEFIVEEVVVTAQRREQNLSDVPLSIGVVDTAALQSSGPRELRDIDQLVANLNITKQADTSNAITIRGVGSFGRNIAYDSRVGVYLDGVYVGQSTASNLGFLDVERVEVLRGPQDTLFGKNNIAGAVSIVTRQPTFTTEGSARAGIGNYAQREAEAIVNLPVADQAAIRLGAAYEERGGYVDNLFDGSKLGGYESKAAIAKFRAALTDDLEVSLWGDGYLFDRKTFAGEAVSNTFASNVDTTAPARATVNHNDPSENERDIWGVSGRVKYSGWNDALVTSITAYRDSKSNYSNDPDYSPLDILGLDYQERYKQFTQELQLNYSPTPGIYIVGGLYYMDIKATTDRLAEAGVHAPVVGVPAGSTISQHGRVDTRGGAVFLDASFKPFDRLTASVGMRYSDETKEVDWALDGRHSGVFRIATTRLVDSHSDNFLSASASLRYALADDFNLYARWANGFKSGGFNLDWLTPEQLSAGNEFDKETVQSLEIGGKGWMFDRLLSVSVALFHNRFSDYQVNRALDLGGGRTIFVIRNAAKVETSGGELELVLRPTAALTLTSALGLLDTQFKSFPGGAVGGRDARGNKLPNAADMTLSSAVDYRLPISKAMDLNMGADVYYSDGYYTTPDNLKSVELRSGSGALNAVVPYGYVPGYALLNARLSLIERDDRWRATAWVRNLTDKEYITFSNRDFFGTIVEAPAIGRTYGLSFAAKF